MAKYRKKPIIIEAIQWTGKNDEEIELFIGESLEGYCYYGNKLMYIRTLEGIMTASVDDYIIKGIQGEFYPCKPDVFIKTYERVD